MRREPSLTGLRIVAQCAANDDVLYNPRAKGTKNTWVSIIVDLCKGSILLELCRLSFDIHEFFMICISQLQYDTIFPVIDLVSVHLHVG